MAANIPSSPVEMFASIFTNLALLFSFFEAVKDAPTVGNGDSVVVRDGLAVRNTNIALSRREADWQLELFQGGDWACNGEEMFIQTTYPEFPENECVNLGAQTDSGYFAYAGTGLCATVYADSNCQVALWQIINTDQCYWGLAGGYIWIEYNCPPLQTGPIAKRDMEIAVRDTNTDLIPFDKAKLHPGLRLVTPEPTTKPVDKLTADDPKSTLAIRDDSFQLNVWQSGASCNIQPLDIAAVYELNTCVQLDAWAGFSSFSSAPAGLCATFYATSDCQVPVWQLSDINECVGGAPAGAVWIQYDCPEVSIYQVPGVPLVPSTLSSGPSQAPFPNGHTRRAMPTVYLSDLVASSRNSTDDDGENTTPAKRDGQPFWLEIYDDEAGSAFDAGCNNLPLIDDGTPIPEDTCVVIDDPTIIGNGQQKISSAQFAYLDGAPNVCATIFPTQDCSVTLEVWTVTGINQCHRGPTGIAFVVNSECH